MLKKLFAGALLVGVAAVVLPALAQPSVDLVVETENVSLVAGCESAGGGDPMQTWEVALSVSVNNTSEDLARFTSTGYFVKFTNPAGPQQTSYDIEVVDAGGFVAGEEVDPGGSETFHPIVRVSLPCDATGASMFATLNLEGRDKTYLDGAVFLQDGTPVPLGPTGVIGIAIALAAVGMLVQRLGRRPRTATAHPASR